MQNLNTSYHLAGNMNNDCPVVHISNDDCWLIDGTCTEMRRIDQGVSFHAQYSHEITCLLLMCQRGLG